ERDGRVRPDHALNRGMRNVPLMPQRDVLHCWKRVGAHHACKAGQVLAQHWVALVRHRRGSLLPGREVLLRLKDLCALEVPDLDSETLDRGGYDTKRHEIMRMPVAWNDLRRDGLWPQPHLLPHIRLNP